jgi:hypothetical protein
VARRLALSRHFEQLCVPLEITSLFGDATQYYAKVAEERWIYFFLNAQDAWVQTQFRDAGLLAELNPNWVFLVQFEDDLLLESVTIVPRAVVDRKRQSNDDDDASDEHRVSVFRGGSRDPDPLDSLAWVKVLVDLQRKHRKDN